MKVQTISIVVGDNRCNSSCPFCIAKMTNNNMPLIKEVNWRNFDIACKLADKAGVTTVLLTGKGEPTLHPVEILQYLIGLKENNDNFPFIELQTNGIKLGDPNFKFQYEKPLQSKLPECAIDFINCFTNKDWATIWYKNGLTTICLSAVHYLREVNQNIYGKDYPDIRELVPMLHKIGYTVRLSIMLMKGGIESTQDVDRLVSFCKEHKISQLTIRPIDSHDTKGHGSQAEFVDTHTLTDEWQDIKNHVKNVATPILNLAHGATVYDFMGQNLCLGTCMTTDNDEDHMRQLIFFPNGELRWDWKYDGSVLLKGIEE